MRAVRFLPLVLSIFLAGCSLISGGPTALIPREILFSNPARSHPQISPDGRYLAFLAPDEKNVLQLWVRELNGKNERRLTDEKRRGIRYYVWSYDNEQLIFAQDSDGDENWHLYTVGIASGAIRNLTPYKGVRSVVVALEPAHPGEMLIAMNLRDRKLHDVYRVDLRTGETVMVNRNGGRQVWWAADGNLKVRLATTINATIVREAEKGPWKTLRRWQAAEFGRFFGLSRDEKTFYMRGAPDENTGALLAIDLASGKETVLAHDPEYDLDDVFVHPVTREIQAVAFYKDTLEWQVLDPAIAGEFADLKALHKGEFTVIHPSSTPAMPSSNLGRRDLQDRIWIVSYAGDDGSVRHFAYERASRRMTFLFNERPNLERWKLAPMRPIAYQARDGLTIRGYLTLPVQDAAKNLPAVLLVHGGPWSRDEWRYHDAVQWLANRGYAVLQANYRGSTGYGRKFVLASYKEWGAKMHDDLVDGVDWLVREGIADPKRIAIMGASYGGYATLVGLTLTPDLFAAGVSRVGISNLLTFYQTYPAYWSPVTPAFKRRIGDPQTEEEMLKSRSPVFFVDRVKAPLLIGHGVNDVRVVVNESEQMVEALRREKKPVEYVVYGDEGHSLVRPENKFHFYAKAEEFLAKHLGGRYEPEGVVSGHAGVTK